MTNNYPPPPGFSGGSVQGLTLDTLLTSDTFKVWFNTTNDLVNAINPLEIYGLTAGSGISIDYLTNTGIAKLSFTLPNSISGSSEFTGGLTFSGDNLIFNGGTVDFTGSNVYGNVVRTVNGSTGDVTVSAIVQLPTIGQDGDIVVFNTAGSTFEPQRFFTGETGDRLYVGASGGLVLGATTDGAGNLGRANIQLVGNTGATASIYLRDGNYAGSNIREVGSFIQFLRNSDANTLCYH